MPLILTVNRVGAVGQGLAGVCLGLDAAFFSVQVHDVGVAATQKDKGGVLPVFVRGEKHWLLHVGVRKTNLGHGGGITERLVDKIEDGLGVILPNATDEFFSGKLVKGKTLRGQIASGTELLLMMRGLGIEVIDGVIVLAHLPESIDSVLGYDVILLEEGTV